MSRQEHGSVQNPGPDRVLRLGTLNIHNHHVQRGRRTARTCRVCSEGLESVLAPVVQATTGDEKPSDLESDGADEEGDASLPPDSWPGLGGEKE